MWANVETLRSTPELDRDGEEKVQPVWLNWSKNSGRC